MTDFVCNGMELHFSSCTIQLNLRAWVLYLNLVQRFNACVACSELSGGLWN